MAENLNITNQPIQPTKLTPKPRSLISSQLLSVHSSAKVYIDLSSPVNKQI